MQPRTLVVCAALAFACKGSKQEPPRDAGGGGSALVEQAVPQIVATCAELLGPADARRKGEPTWEPIKIGTTFRERDWVRTGVEGYARLRFSDRRFIDMPEKTTVLIDTAITIEVGTLVAVASGGETLRVKAPDGTVAQIVSASGDEQSELRLTPSKDKGLEIAVTRGNVRVVTGAGEQAVAAGEASDVANERTSAVVKLLPAPTGLTSKDRVQLAAGLALPLGWSPVRGAVRYRLQVARDPQFRVLVYDRDHTEPGASFSPDLPGDYTWRVTAVDAKERIGAGSAPRKIQVDPEPPPDLLLAPAAGAKIGFADRAPTVTFTWRSAGKDMQYRLVVVRGTDMSAEPVATATTSALRAEIKTLREGVYHWGVYARGEAGETPLFPAPRALTIRKQRVKVHTEKLWQSPR